MGRVDAAATTWMVLSRRGRDAISFSRGPPYRDDAASTLYILSNRYKASPDCRYVVCDGGKALFASETALALIPEAEARAFGIDDEASGTTTAFLGLAGGAPLFAVNARTGLDDERFRDTRTQAPFLSLTENQVALAATAITTWHRCSLGGISHFAH